MTNKVNYNPAGKIKLHFLLVFLIWLLASAQASPQKLKIYISGKSNSKTAWTVDDHLKVKLTDFLKEQYPCASIFTDDGVAAMLAWAKLRALMGTPDEDAISAVAGAIGAQFTVSVNVIHVNNTITITATGQDDRRGKTVSKQDAVAQSGDEALDAAEALAEKLASDLIKSMPDCYVNEWVGTITYQRVLQGENRTTEEGFSVSGTTTTEFTTKSTAEANFEVRGSKKPAKATVKWKEESLKNAITKQTITCGGMTPFEQGKTVTRNVTEIEKTTSNAEGKVDAVASVSLNGDEYTISFTVPEIDGGIGVRDWTWKDSGGCGPPENKHESNSIQFTTQELYEQVKGKIDQEKPDVLTGSQTVSGSPSLVPSMKQTTIISWNLNFKRAPQVIR